MSCVPPGADRLPDERAAQRPTAELFAEILGAFKGRGFPDTAALTATYFAFFTWFSALLPCAPCHLITGAGPEARLLLELLECVVRHPLPLFELTRGGFLSIDMNSEPTLLIAQEDITDSLWKLLRASNHRNAQISGANGTRKIYCAKAIYLADESIGVRSDHSLLQINLSPLRGRLPILGADEKRG
jgi:hypothetical protein